MTRSPIARMALLSVLLVRGASLAEPPPEAADSADRRAAALMTEKRWAEAAKVLDELTRREPSNADAWRRLCQCLHELGDVPRALEACRKAADLPLDPVDSLLRMVRMDARAGKQDRAIQTLNNAIDRGFCDATLLENDPDLAPLRKDDRFAYIRRRLAVSSVQLARELDFLIGQWRVLGADDKPLGQSRVERAERGFVLVEEWTSVAGDTARTMMFVDPSWRRWRAICVASGGDVSECAGTFTDGAMRLSGTFRSADGRVRPMRCTITPLPEGKVRRAVEQSKDEGETWLVFDDWRYFPATMTDERVHSPSKLPKLPANPLTPGASPNPTSKIALPD